MRVVTCTAENQFVLESEDDIDMPDIEASKLSRRVLPNELGVRTIAINTLLKKILAKRDVRKTIRSSVGDNVYISAVSDPTWHGKKNAIAYFFFGCHMNTDFTIFQHTISTSTGECVQQEMAESTIEIIKLCVSIVTEEKKKLRLDTTMDSILS
jgi:hypothetical protein